MKCPVCGADNEATAAFCYRCGSSLKPTTSATGPTVNLNQAESSRDHGVFADDDAEHAARVYDVPATSASETTSSYGTSSTGNFGGTPYTPAPPAPQYNFPSQGQGGGSYSQPHGMAVMPQQNNTALIALILAIVSYVFLPLIGSIIAVVLGRNARKEIQASNGMMTGDGMAQAAIVLGWINIALSLIGFCFICIIPFLTILGSSAGS